ncbi:FUSC family protein [Streptomyces sp. TRM66268-LWL]|uniref:FUSC family protein n=1 Tax=Streptomyces polyasparticus TaxID=2767826 RepID=A0ABR7SU80_9ACTN|nr:FUSC family protein [Streptomyces polyasparticus]MBC9719030.1 FUSC family protein [Streptomyces polyasparticus]
MGLTGGGPPWLRHTVRTRPVPVDRALVVRGALGMLVPLAVGQVAGRPDLGAAAALGAYGAAVDDSAAPWRTRALTLVLPQLGGAAGLALGRLTHGEAWAQILLVTVVALVSGLVSTIGRISDMATLVLLLATAMGLGLPAGPPWWQVPLLFLLGGIPLMLLSLGHALRRPGEGERQAVAGALRAVADLLDATDGTWAERRHAVTEAMDAAYDTVLVRRLSAPRPGSATARLTGVLDLLVEVIGVAPVVLAPRAGTVEGYARALREVADAVAAGTPTTDAHLPVRPDDAAARALHTAIARLATSPAERTSGRAADQQTAATPRRVSPPPAPRHRLARALSGRLHDAAARRYALRLAVCLGLAQTVASLSGLPRSGWLVLTVALVVRPGLGTVPARLVLRAAGTTAGVLLGLAAMAVFPAGWWRIAVTVVLTGLLQAYARRNYALQTLFLTPVMLLLADPLGQAGSAVPEARLLDTLIGCGIAFVCGYLLWPEDTRSRLPHRLATAHDTIAAYADRLPAHVDDSAALHTLRRRVHAELAAVRTELARLRTDPRHRTTLDDWHDDLTYAETAMTRLTTHAAAGHPRTSELGDLAEDLRRRAARLRKDS